MQAALDFLITPQLSPHGFCLAWQPGLMWLHIASDSVISVAYFGIAVALAVFVQRRRDLALGWMFWMFATFILACGVTHVFEIVTLFDPVYGLQGVAKAITALASILTAILLWPLIPPLLEVPTPAELRRVTGRLSTALAEQHHTEAALRASEQRYQLLVDGVTDYALFMLDPRGHVANWNRGAQRTKGYAADEIVGEHFSRFYTEEDRASGKPQNGLAVAEREGRYEEEGWRVRRDGARFWASVVIDAIRDDSGRLLGFAKVTRDITEKRAAAEAIEQSRAALAQAQKMEAIGHLTGGVAHDFNNLLTAVLGSLDLLERRQGLVTEPGTLRLLGIARQAAERGADLTKQLLAFARKQALAPRATDVNQLVEGFSDLLRRTLGAGITVENRLADGLWRTFADPNQLENVLLNLAVNARDAMPDGGRLAIETGNMHLDRLKSAADGELTPGDYVMVAVADTGTGMTADVIARAFEPFFTTKPDGRGTGLGLSQVFGFIKQSGGHIEIHSEPGRGTKVTLYLPRHHDESVVEPVATPPAVGPVGRGETVLIVEDDPNVRDYATQAIADLGFVVLAAADAAAALSTLDIHPEVALLFTDIDLPGGNGRQLADEAVRRRPGLRLLFTTGYAHQAIARNGLVDREIIVVAKPFTRDSLAVKLREAMRAAGSAAQANGDA